MGKIFKAMISYFAHKQKKIFFLIFFLKIFIAVVFIKMKFLQC